MGYVRIGRAKSVHDMNGQLIKVNRDIHESKGVNVVFDVLHIGCNGSITLLSASKILAMGHDLSSRMRGIFFSRVVHVAREVVEVEINCTRVVETDPIIALRNNWSCRSQRV